MPQLKPMPLSCRGNEPIGRIFVLPRPRGGLAGNRLCDWQYLKTFQRQIQPGLGVWTRELACVPLAHDFHAGDGTKVAACALRFEGCLDCSSSRETAHEAKPNSGIR